MQILYRLPLLQLRQPPIVVLRQAAVFGLALAVAQQARGLQPTSLLFREIGVLVSGDLGISRGSITIALVAGAACCSGCCSGGCSACWVLGCGLGLPGRATAFGLGCLVPSACGALDLCMPPSTTTSVGPPIKIKCSTLSRRTRTRRRRELTAAASRTARRGCRFDPPRMNAMCPRRFRNQKSSTSTTTIAAPIPSIETQVIPPSLKIVSFMKQCPEFSSQG